MNYRLAEIPLTISGSAPDGLLERMAAYRTEEESSDGLRIYCHMEASLAPAVPTEWLGSRGIMEEYLRCGEDYLTQFRLKDRIFASLRFAPDFRSVDCAFVDVEPFGGMPVGDWLTALVGKCFLNCLPAFGGVTYHASAIRFREDALLFCAPSGTGKSTQARLWKETYPDEVTYINDDTPVLRMHEGIVRAYGTPWAGRSGINTNTGAPVRAFIYIKRAAESSITTLSEEEGFLRALGSLREQVYKEERSRQLEIAAEAARGASYYELRSSGKPEDVETLFRALYG